MSHNPEISQGLTKDSIWNRRINRRNFIRSAGLMVAALAATKFTPAIGVDKFSSPELASPEAAETPTVIDWSSLPLIENEPPAFGTVEVAQPLADILTETRIVTGDDLNMREVDNIENIVTSLSHNSLVRILPEPDGAALPTKSGYELPRANQLILNEEGKLIVSNQGRLAEALTGPLTADAEGNITFYDSNQKKEVTIAVTTPLVRYEQRDLVMPDPSLVRTSESLAQSFNASAIGGGEGVAEAKSENAWGNKKLTVFQRAVAFAAIDEGLKKPEDRTGVSEVDSILGQGKELFQLAIHHAGDHLDVISRIGTGATDDKFIVTRVSHNSSENADGMAGFSMSVDGVGVATWEALVEAYGEDAVTYASNATTLQVTQEDIDEFASMEKAGVFLAGIEENGIIVPKVATKADTTRVAYERVDVDKGKASYRAVLFSQDAETKEEIQMGEARFMVGPESAEWVGMPEEADLEAFVDIYAQVYSLDEKEVREQLRFEQKNDYTGKPYVVILHENRPLMVWALGQEQSEWHEATPEIAGAFNERQIKVYTSVDGAEPYSSEVYKKTYAKFNGLAPSGSFLQSALKQYTIADRFTKYVAEHGESLRVHTSFFHQIIKGDLDANATREMVDSYVDYHIEQLYGVLDKFQDRIPEIEMIFANEPKWKSGPRSGWEESPLYSAYGEEWPVEIFVRLYQAAEQRGYDIGNKLTFMFNDYGIGVDSVIANEYTKADMVRQDIQTIKNKIARRLDIREEDVPMSIGFQGWAAFGSQAQEKAWFLNGTQLINMDRSQVVSLIANNIDSFADVLDPSGTERPVNVTEIGTYGASENEQAEYISRWAAGIKQSGRADSIGFWSPLRDPSIKGGDDMSLFDVKSVVAKRNSNGGVEIVGFKPRKAYYELNAALYN